MFGNAEIEKVRSEITKKLIYLGLAHYIVVAAIGMTSMDVTNLRQ